MAAVNQTWDVAEAAVRAVSAGADGVLNTGGQTAKDMRHGLVAAVQVGTLDESRVNEAASRMVALAGGDPRPVTCTTGDWLPDGDFARHAAGAGTPLVPTHPDRADPLDAGGRVPAQRRGSVSLLGVSRRTTIVLGAGGGGAGGRPGHRRLEQAVARAVEPDRLQGGATTIAPPTTSPGPPPAPRPSSGRPGPRSRAASSGSATPVPRRPRPTSPTPSGLRSASTAPPASPSRRSSPTTRPGRASPASTW